MNQRNAVFQNRRSTMMSLELVAGRALQVAGRLWEYWGRLTDNEISRQHGYQMIVVGQMRVLGAQAADLLRYCTPRQALGVQPVRYRR
jgi:uncharacterized protein YjbJ (UPF0337 family)